MIKRLWMVGVAVVVILLLIGGIVAYNVFFGANEFLDENERTFYVSKGQTFATIVDSLESHRIIRSREKFVFVARVLGGTTRMQVGKYVFRSGISNYDLFLTLRDGKHLSLISVTIPEGLRPRMQAQIFAQTLGIDSAKFVRLVYDEPFTHSLDVDAPSLEGYLMPDTYGFYWQQDESDIIKVMVEEFHEFYTDSMKQLAKELGWTTNQVLALASIVEGEAVVADERDTISGVYHNRLRKGMKLEADPTIQYIFESGPRRVLYSDLKIDHPYNTYRIKGLPPGPVNNPGKASIIAALYPAKNDYLFFVADGQGGHRFARTYADHLRFVRLYRKQRAQQVQSVMEAKRKGGVN